MSSDDSERRLAEALRAQARGGGRPVLPPRSGSSAAPAGGPSVRTLLLLWLLGGALLGAVLACVSLLAPGVLPAFG